MYHKMADDVNNTQINIQIGIFGCFCLFVWGVLGRLGFVGLV